MAKNSGCFTTTAVAFGIFLIVGIIGHGVSPNAPDPNQAVQDREQTKEKAQKASDEAAADLNPHSPDDIGVARSRKSIQT